MKANSLCSEPAVMSLYHGPDPSAPERFADWLSNRTHVDRRFGHVYRYHPRSQAHSDKLAELIADDLLAASEEIRRQAADGRIGAGINVPHVWPTTGKKKALHLAIGTAMKQAPLPEANSIGRFEAFAEVRIACEAKSVMTEHGKSQPRVYDELSSSHEIVHQGSDTAIAAGITVVNLAARYVSPTRQKSSDSLKWTTHQQPAVTRRMVKHLRGLAIREKLGDVGFDAYCTFVIDCDNIRPARLVTESPAPQDGDPDHYGTFLRRIVAAYQRRFA